MENIELVSKNRGGGFLVCMCLPLKEVSNWTEKFWFDIELTDDLEIIPEKCCIYMFREMVYFTYFPEAMVTKEFLEFLENEATKRVKTYLKLKAKDGKPQLAD